LQGLRISSTRIRKALAEGELSIVNTLLGQAYQLSGRIRHGDKKGRTIGFPTINMKVPKNIAPRLGVYAVKIHGLDRDLETHVFDFDSLVYGQHIRIELIEFIRDEKHFETFEVLKQQIIKDAETAKRILQN